VLRSSEIKPLFKDLSSSNCAVWATFFSQLFSSLWVSQELGKSKWGVGYFKKIFSKKFFVMGFSKKEK